MGGALPPWHGGIHPPSPRIPPYYMSKCRFGGDNTLDCANKFLGKKCPFSEYLFDMKKKYIITESQFKLLTEDSIMGLLSVGCVVGGAWGLATVIIDSMENNKKKKEELKRLQKIQSSINLIFEMVIKNDYKSFSVDICELKDKSVNFIQKHGDRTEFPIQIKEAKFTCLVQPQENKFYTLIEMKGVDLRNDSNRNISLRRGGYNNNVEWYAEGKRFFGREVENNKLLNYITNDLKFPIGSFKYRPTTEIKTDF